MHTLIDAFPKQLKEALEIGRKAQLKAPGGPYGNVVVTGLGGSGIGGRIAAQLVHKEAKCPIEVYNNYYLPGYVNHKSLVIACSYSGNTEETLRRHGAGLEQGRRVVVITSGGTMLDMAKAKGLDHIVIPGGNPPRTMLAYSLVQQFFVLHHFGIIGDGFEGAIKTAANMLEDEKEAIKKAAQELTDKLVGKRLVIYSEASTEAVSIRFRQQVNENSKELCWHHAIPEMNHNELVGWAGGKDDIAVVIFRHKEDHERSQIRMEINKEVFKQVHPAHPRRVEPGRYRLRAPAVPDQPGRLGELLLGREEGRGPHRDRGDQHAEGQAGGGEVSRSRDFVSKRQVSDPDCRYRHFPPLIGTRPNRSLASRPLHPVRQVHFRLDLGLRSTTPRRGTTRPSCSRPRSTGRSPTATYRGGSADANRCPPRTTCSSASTRMCTPWARAASRATCC
jgi:glucose/mannose-6-phosphate isomerase